MKSISFPLLISTFFFVLISVSPCQGRRTIMPWMCLERCGGNPNSIAANLAQLKKHSDIITSVSFEKYNLGTKNDWVINNLTDVNPQLHELGLEIFPMISSYPYPPDFLDRMRYLFKNPDLWIDLGIKYAVENDYSGYNIDFEPTSTEATEQDALDYITFLNRFASALHNVDKKLTVAISDWSVIWNYHLLGESKIDRLNIMATYTGNFTTFVEKFVEAKSSIPLEKLGIGIETISTETNKPLTTEELQKRFDLMIESDIEEIDIWLMPLYDNWWPFLEKFRQSE